MKKTWWLVPVAGAGAVVARRAWPSGSRSGGRPDDRWLTVTINRPIDDIGTGEKPPPPLDRFGESIDVRTRPAPGGRGTELAVRPAEREARERSSSVPARLSGQDPRQELRHALREAKAVLEAGEVLHADTPPTTRPTPAGKLLGLLNRRSGGEGVL
ncbi:hypothetical protein TU94_32395 [Streptomyces cyaneogriseus subsp. noncyanogenus]|uniref:Uncharacterized protein n=1 Tax=Streptomyces cyaneogriseus subsp. noncyanogenus TaxID=477245 RepID=A0A0C5G999_9ACTN|nr:hypothetical protein [Streptomyces cyaneogriseus]AJP05405.1 hypothetical protein TU94_32395 [Streptomyces cyaneogriseus subsp. noncyanogenus]